MQNTKTSWYELLKKVMEAHDDSFEDRVCTLTEDELRAEFDAGWFGVDESAPFVAWGRNHVYFPIRYDGKASIGFAPRNPSYSATGELLTKPMEHQGGG
ncbi:MAG: hypothetical protein ACRC62_19210 [Microcoleus sp.]